MAERSDHSRGTITIVPERDDTFHPAPGSRHRHRSSSQRHGTRVWPLYLLFVLCIGAIGLLVAWYWQDRHGLMQRNASLEAHIAQLSVRLEATGQSVHASGATLESEVDQLRSSLTVLQQDLKAQQQTMSHLPRIAPERVEGIESHISRLVQDNEAQQGRLVALEQSLGTLNGTLDKIREKMDTRLTAVEQRLPGLEQNIKANANRFATFETRMDSLDGTIKKTLEDRQRQGDQAEDDMNQLRDQISQSQQRIESLVSANDKLGTRIEALQRAQTSLAATQTMLNDQLSNSPSNSDVQQRLKSLEASRRQLSGRVAQLISDVSALSHQVETAQGR